MNDSIIRLIVIAAVVVGACRRSKWAQSIRLLMTGYEWKKLLARRQQIRADRADDELLVAGTHHIAADKSHLCRSNEPFSRPHSRQEEHRFRFKTDSMAVAHATRNTRDRSKITKK
jgi:hypothetical protein